MTLEFTKPPDKPTINVLLYGAPKTGKSVGAGSAPGGLLFINCDQPAATRFVHRQNPDGRIMETKLPSFEKGKNHQLLDLLGEIALAVSTPGQSLIQSVVIDPIGELHRRMLEEQAQRAIRPARNDYGDIAVHIERFCRFLCEQPNVNVVLVCHELVQKDEETGEMLRIPFTGTQAGSAVLGQKLMSMVDIVGYTGVMEQEDKTTDYMAQLVPAKGRLGGDRFNCLGAARRVDLADWLRVIEEDESRPVSTLKHDFRQPLLLPFPGGNDGTTGSTTDEAEEVSALDELPIPSASAMMDADSQPQSERSS